MCSFLTMSTVYDHLDNLSTVWVILYPLPHPEPVPTETHQDSFKILVGTARPGSFRPIVVGAMNRTPIVGSLSVVLGHDPTCCCTGLIILDHATRGFFVDYPTHARTNPIVQVTMATKLTTICGVFFTRSVHVRNAMVPRVNATMFQGYADGPRALSTCPAMIARAPVHCMISFVLFMCVL